MDLILAIITPTLNRDKFIFKFYQKLLEQTNQNWVWVVCHDGPPSEKLISFFSNLNDKRIHFTNTPNPSHDYGQTPRIQSIELLQNKSTNCSYFVLWDDDDLYYDYAIEQIKREIKFAQFPDLCIVPFDAGFVVVPPEHTIQAVTRILNACFVMKVETFLPILKKIKSSKAFERGEDLRLFDYVKQHQEIKVAFFKENNAVGLYDGLRPLTRLRWKLKIPPFNISKIPLLNKIRQLIRIKT